MNSLQPAHFAGAVAVKGLCNFFLGIHDERAIGDDRFVRAPYKSFHGDIVVPYIENSH